MSLEDQRIIVVGGSSGMGLAVAKALVEAGSKVVIAGRSQEKLDSAREHIPGDVDTHSLDFTDEEAVREFFTEFITQPIHQQQGFSIVLTG